MRSVGDTPSASSMMSVCPNFPGHPCVPNTDLTAAWYVKGEILRATFWSHLPNEAVRDYVRASITALEATEQQLQLWVDNGRLVPSWTKLRSFLFATGLSIFVSVQFHPPSHYIYLIKRERPCKQTNETIPLDA